MVGLMRFPKKSQRPQQRQSFEDKLSVYGAGLGLLVFRVWTLRVSFCELFVTHPTISGLLLRNLV